MIKQTIAATACLAFASSMAIANDQLTGALPALPRGIEHVLYLSVKSDPASPLLTQPNDGDVTARLIVTLRISAHSQETNFFGFIPATVSEFDLTKGSAEKEVWRDRQCHHERGLPKITVTSIDGLVTSRQQRHPILARWRQIGLFLPRDEVQTSKRIGADSDKIGPYIETRTETKESRLFVDLKLYVLPCDLSFTTHRGPAAASVNR